jgi:hypothetical protein
VNGTEVQVDSRPSDAIALSVRAHVPILVHSSVMDEAGIIPEQDMPEGEVEPERRASRPHVGGEHRAPVRLRRFPGKLDFDNLDGWHNPMTSTGQTQKTKEEMTDYLPNEVPYGMISPPPPPRQRQSRTAVKPKKPS